MELQARNTYRLKVKRGRVVILRVATINVKRMSAEIKARYPDAKIEKVGRRVTMESAEKWVFRGEG